MNSFSGFLRILRHNLQLVVISFILSNFLVSCALYESNVTTLDTQELKEKWMQSNFFFSRELVIQEFERRKEIKPLLDCLSISVTHPYNKDMHIRSTDTIMIIEALGRLGDHKAISTIFESSARRSEEVAQASLKAYKLINHKDAVGPTIQMMSTFGDEVLWQSLDVLGQLGDPRSTDAVSKSLFNENPNIRWKALHTLGEIGDTKVIGKVSILLDDQDETVKQLAANILIKLGVAQEKIDQWRVSAKGLTLDDMLRSKRDYYRVIAEKQTLENSLQDERDIKEQLEASLVQRDTVLAKQKEALGNLYEKERLLRSKTTQLEITKNESKKYQTKIEQMTQLVEETNNSVLAANSQGSSDLALEQLNYALESKAKSEEQAKYLSIQTSHLTQEIESLRLSSGTARQEISALKHKLKTFHERESDLSNQIDDLSQRLNQEIAPILVISKPIDGFICESPFTLLHFIGVDDKGIESVIVRVNGLVQKIDSGRGISIQPKIQPVPKSRVDITKRIELKEGENIVEVSIIDTKGVSTSEKITVIRRKKQNKIWGVVVGINQYLHAQPLKYAINDATGIKNYLEKDIGIPSENIFVFLDENATKYNILSLLGTKLKRQVARNDTVIIFFAGHGAIETDPSNPDGDGFEKYLLPYDANLDDLFTTSISVNELRTVFERIQADRLIFFADTCYSGATGGRTLKANKSRASLSDNFFDRISKGKGRIIISSSSANEISKESEALEHGIFTYFLLQGLQGNADTNGDQIITVGELFTYLSQTVPEASDQDQHPVRKGETEGEFVIGYVN